MFLLNELWKRTIEYKFILTAKNFYTTRKFLVDFWLIWELGNRLLK